MPRYRKLHVKAVESLDINEMPDDFTRLFWIMLPLALDRDGRGMDSTSWLKSRVFPLRLDVTPEMLTGAMAWFDSRHMIERYEVEGRRYFWVPTFYKYQGNTIKEAESEYPAPPKWTSPRPTPEERPQEEQAAQDKPATNSRPTPDLLQSKSVTDADAVFNIQYSNADAVVNTQYADAPAQDQAKGSTPPPGNGRDSPAVMFSALAAAYRMDTKLLTERDRGRLNATVKRLSQAGYTVAEITDAAQFWWTDDWRGKKGSPPNDGQFFQVIAQRRAFLAANPPPPEMRIPCLE